MPPQSSTSRRKPKDDDAAYIGASGSKRPRDSVDKTVVPDGRRAKRKKVQSVTQELASLPPSLVDFTTLPREVVYQYLVHFDIMPILHPSPISASSPPPPEALLDPQSSQPIKFPSPTATVTMPTDHTAQQHPPIIPNVRPSPQRQQHDHSIFSPKHHRSLDDDEDLVSPSSSNRTTTLADIADLDIILARLAERHFREGSVHELDTLATFLALVKNSANGKLPFIIVSSM